MFSRVPSRTLSNYNRQQQADKARMKHFNESIDRDKKMRSEIIKKKVIANTEISATSRIESDIPFRKEKCQEDDSQEKNKNWFYKDDPDEFEQFCVWKKASIS